MAFTLPDLALSEEAAVVQPVGNWGGVVLPSATRTIGPAGLDFVNPSARGIILTLGVYSNPGDAGFLRMTLLLLDAFGNVGAGIAFIDAAPMANNIYQLIVQQGAINPGGTQLIKAFGYGIGPFYRVLLEHSLPGGAWGYYINQNLCL